MFQQDRHFPQDRGSNSVRGLADVYSGKLVSDRRDPEQNLWSTKRSKKDLVPNGQDLLKSSTRTMVYNDRLVLQEPNNHSIQRRS